MTAPVVAQYPKDAPRGTGATGGEFVPQGTTPAKTQPKAAPAAKPKPKPAQKKPAAKPTGPGKPGSARLNLKVGGNNDPAEVRNLQQLLKDLQLGNLAVDGQFGSDTQAAVKAAQTKLGMKPTGRASSAFIKRLADAHALSPCIKKVSAAAVVDEIEDEDDEQDPELVMASTAAGLGLSLWSDSTIWVADAEGETMELDLDDADRVVAGLRLLPDDREPGSYEVTDRLTLQVAEDLSTSLVAEEEDDAIELRLADLNEFADQLASMFEPAAVAAARAAVTARKPKSVVAKFNPNQPRDWRGRWGLTAAVIDALKAQGGEQGHATFDDGRYFDWSTYDPHTRTYDLEIGDGDDNAVSFNVEDYDLEQLFNALTVTKLRDEQGHLEGGSQSANVAALAALGHGDGLNLGDGGYIDWSSGTENGDYGFAAENGEDSVEFDLSPADLSKLIASLALSTQTPEALGETVTAAAGHDVTPRHDELHHYWTRGEGLAKWSKSLTPWTTLVALLTPHVGPEKAKVYASKWFKEVKGYSSGSDANRVAHGHPPRGNNVGPG